MPTRYCASKGCKIDYTSITPPTKCPICGFELAQAFKVATTTTVLPPSQPTSGAPTFTLEQVQAMLAQQAQGSQPAPTQSQQPRRGTRKRPADSYNAGNGPAHESADGDVDEGQVSDGYSGIVTDQFDSYEVRANAKLLSQGISEDDFQIGVEESNVKKLGDVVKIVSETPKRGRKRKG